MTAAVGLKAATMGDMDCALDQVVIAKKTVIPEPVIFQAVELKTEPDQENIVVVLNRPTQKD